MKSVCRPLLVLLVFCASQAEAQNCNSGIPESTPITQFLLHGDGTLTDTHHHLRWQRCAVGQHWTGKGCEGEARKITYDNARQQQTDSWRLPSLPELSRIVELRCSQPAINLHLFPNTPAGDFWSATDFANSQADQPRYWQVQFIYGETNLGGTKDWAYLRLIRDEN